MYKAVDANKRNTWVIMGLFVILIGGLGWIISEAYGGSTGIFWGTLAGALVYALFQYFLAARIALAVNGAKEIEKRDDPRLYRLVENLAITAGIPTPRVYVIDDPAPNAFATGRDPNHSHVAVTTGLLAIMNDQELEAVLAHEIAHVQNYDIRVMMIVFGLVSAIGLIADLFLRMLWFGGDDEQPNPAFMALAIVAAIISPIVAMLVQLAVSRQREYLADATGALTTRYPEGLASALEKLQHAGTGLKRQNSSTAHLFFANPLKGKALSSLLSTHPPLEDRIARLRKMGSQF